MEKRKYWMWARRKLTDKPLVGTLYHKISSTCNDLREEQDLVEDAASNLGDYIWPPRSYSCSFCRREFRSAQALGGHMNVHRRDRARLKQSPSPTGEGQEKQLPDQVGSLVCRTLSSPNCIAVASMHEHSDNTSDRFLTDPRTAQRVAMMDMNLGKEKLKLREVGYSIPSCRSDHDDDVDLISGKRRHMDPMFPFFMKSSSDQHHHHHQQQQQRQQQQQQPEVLKLGARPVEELDLELRLGSDPKF